MDSTKSQVKEFAKSILGSLIFVLLLTQFVIKPIQVNQSSMYPTLKDQQLGFSNIWSYKLFGLKRFDVVIFYSAQMDDYLVKRVIALPNETIEVKEGVLYIDGFKTIEPFLDQKYVEEMTQQFGYFTQDFGPISLKDNEVFLMGDNRPYSTDSRVFGPFTEDTILCKDVIVFYPFNEIHAVLGWNGNTP